MDTSVTSSVLASKIFGTGLSSPSLSSTRVVMNLGPQISQYIASILKCETNSPFSPPLMITLVRATISLKWISMYGSSSLSAGLHDVGASPSFDKNTFSGVQGQSSLDEEAEIISTGTSSSVIIGSEQT
jgi:hypothetical protein